jgi:iron complex outermembrane recepter protein
MTGWIMRCTVLAALSCALLSVTLAAPADAFVRKSISIPPESLDLALRTLAKDRHLQVLYRADLVQNIRTSGAFGSLTSEEALTKVLMGTGLSFKYLDPQTVTIVSRDSSGTADSARSDRAQPTDKYSKEAGEKTSQDFHLAQVDQGKSAGLFSVTEQGSTSAINSATPLVGLQEIVVTANKRSENVETVPASVSVLTGAAIEELHATQLSEYAGYVPGLIVDTNGTPGQSTITIRGIVPLGDSPSVATYIDDSPLGASDGHSKSAEFALDLFPDDIERIEILRGPEGTLYGASSLGGVLKYVTVAPDPTKFTARVGGEISDTKGAANAGWNIHGAVNLPLIDNSMALRVSYFDKTQPGYVTDGTTGEAHENANRVNGGRISLLWDVNSDLSVKLSAMFQNIDSKGNATLSLNPTTLQPIYGDLTSAHDLLQPFWQYLSYYSATVNWSLPWADFMSATSYSDNRSNRNQDLSVEFGSLFPLFGAPAGLAPYRGTLSTDKITQEFRLSSHSGSALEWLVGTFLTHESSVNGQYISAWDTNQIPIPALDPLGVTSQNTTYKEGAVFGNLTYNFSSAFSVTGGLREAHNSQLFTITELGALVGPPTANTGTSSANDFLYSLSPRFFISDKIMIYARLANGYRPGGPNAQIPGVVIPKTVDADTTHNYEIGTKIQVRNTLTLNASIFRINWDDIQLVTNGPLNYFANGGDARSQGAEFAVNYAPLAGLTLGLNGAFTDAVLTTDAPNINGLDGARLPSVPRWSGSATARYSTPLYEDWSAQAGLGYRYVSDRYSGVSSDPASVRAPPYGALDIDSSLFNKNWSIFLYLKNATDRRGLVSPQLIQTATGSTVQVDTFFILPRTLGAGFTRSF